MDSQSNALYDNVNLPKIGLSDLSFNAQHNKPKILKAGHAVPGSASSNNLGRRFVILPADNKKALESSASPFLSPSPSFAKLKHNHSMKSLRLGR